MWKWEFVDQKKIIWSSVFCLSNSSSSSLIAVAPLEKIILWEVWFAQNKINASSHSTNSFQDMLPRPYLCVCYVSFLHVVWWKFSVAGLYWEMKHLRTRWRGQEGCRGRRMPMTANWGPLENCFFFHSLLHSFYRKQSDRGISSQHLQVNISS